MSELKKKRIAVILCLLFIGLGLFLVRFAADTSLPAQAKQAYENYQLPLATISITGDEEDFWGYDKGILVEGRLFDEYKAEQVAEGRLTEEEAEELEPNELMDANFNHKEWIKQCEVTLTDAEKNILINDRVGLRISGNASRKLCQKSFVIMSGKEYGSKNSRFYVNLGNERINSYNKLRIHSGGQDLRETQLRDELIAKMAEAAGIEPVRETMPVMVYINNEFYGIGHLENRVDEDYLASYYGLQKENIELFAGGIADALEYLGYDSEKEYDFNDKALREQLNSIMDVDNFLKYWTFNMLTDNADWPHNNIVMWRNKGEREEGVAESDGRYRFVLSDMDVTFMAEEKSDPFDELNWGDTGDSYRFFEDILEYEPYREEFVNLIMDQLTLSFNEDMNALWLETIEEGYGEAFDFAQTVASSQIQFEYLTAHEEKTAELYDRIVSRKSRIYDYLYQYYDSGEGYLLKVTPGKDCRLQVSSMLLEPSEEEFVSLRSLGCCLELQAERLTAGDGQLFWYVNGEKMGDISQKLVLDPASVQDGAIEVQVR